MECNVTYETFPFEDIKDVGYIHANPAWNAWIQLLSATIGEYLKNTSFGVLNPRHFLGRLISLSSAEIEKQLVISENTAKGHVRNILSKLQLYNRTKAAVMG
ncbi:MAG: hypothetical protein A2Z14_13735 [Chloroflexi bacterium RBG_16_48_8]|nr:MAG: hypothetical protein A2Z14_13735 [Chloroflexi bacterium RBG_16_48_8]